MTEQIFEKVVEWEQEPIIEGMVGSVLFCGLITFSFFFTPAELIFFHWVLLTIILLLGEYLFYICCGKGRQVYWRKIKC